MGVEIITTVEPRARKTCSFLPGASSNLFTSYTAVQGWVRSRAENVNEFRLVSNVESSNHGRVVLAPCTLVLVVVPWCFACSVDRDQLRVHPHTRCSIRVQAIDCDTCRIGTEVPGYQTTGCSIRVYDTWCMNMSTRVQEYAYNT